MNICKNPECKKEIPETKRYCDEKCLVRHLEIKKTAKEVAEPETQEKDEYDNSCKVCGKKIPTFISYCSKECIEKSKTPEHTAKLETINEIKEIMDFFGTFHNEGLVHGQHLTACLNYLRKYTPEPYNMSVNKLTSLLSMGKRYIKENYLDGLEAWGVIEVDVNSANKIVYWKGIKALRNNGSGK